MFGLGLDFARLLAFMLAFLLGIAFLGPIGVSFEMFGNVLESLLPASFVRASGMFASFLNDMFSNDAVRERLFSEYAKLRAELTKQRPYFDELSRQYLRGLIEYNDIASSYRNGAVTTLRPNNCPTIKDYQHVDPNEPNALYTIIRQLYNHTDLQVEWLSDKLDLLRPVIAHNRAAIEQLESSRLQEALAMEELEDKIKEDKRKLRLASQQPSYFYRGPIREKAALQYYPRPRPRMRLQLPTPMPPRPEEVHQEVQMVIYQPPVPVDTPAGYLPPAPIDMGAGAEDLSMVYTHGTLDIDTEMLDSPETIDHPVLPEPFAVPAHPAVPAFSAAPALPSGHQTQDNLQGAGTDPLFMEQLCSSFRNLSLACFDSTPASTGFADAAQEVQYMALLQHVGNPVDVPVPTALALAPVPAPVMTPVPAPVMTPVPAPVMTPVPAPVMTPVPAPVMTPVPAPVMTPVPAPVMMPVPAPVMTPVPAPVMTPVPAPVTTPVPAPVPQPIGALVGTGFPHADSFPGHSSVLNILQQQPQPSEPHSFDFSAPGLSSLQTPHQPEAPSWSQEPQPQPQPSNPFNFSGPQPPLKPKAKAPSSSKGLKAKNKGKAAAKNKADNMYPRDDGDEVPLFAPMPTSSALLPSLPRPDVEVPEPARIITTKQLMDIHLRIARAAKDYFANRCKGKISAKNIEKWYAGALERIDGDYGELFFEDGTSSWSPRWDFDPKSAAEDTVKLFYCGQIGPQLDDDDSEEEDTRLGLLRPWFPGFSNAVRQGLLNVIRNLCEQEGIDLQDEISIYALSE
ncbi:hypothetical protein B0T25DRAFT_629474 [Lasiosphaeria hispida]|uniref:Uncharacterized protein n=1 Tax=Lasiosphaeria hispida TaxID=260671 RepID=A0AAJ0HS92_9PEZI|nr:hypothetical protein B0T25DRAFT_629474 [Lasiosphaeria hispida]